MHSLHTVRSWIPRDSAPQAWYRADQGTTGSPVSEHKDISGNGLHSTQGTAGNRPAAPTADANFGGNQTIVFDSTDMLVSTGGGVDISAGWTIVTVSRFNAYSSFNGIFRISTGETTGTGSADGVVCYTSSSGNVVIASPNASTWFKQAAAASAINTTYIWIASCDGTGVSVALERGVVTPGSIAWTTPIAAGVSPSGTFGMPTSGLVVCQGGSWTTANSSLNGPQAEEIVWGRSISSAERDVLKNYFHRRYT